MKTYLRNLFLFGFSAIVTGFQVNAQDESALTLAGRWSEGNCYTLTAVGEVGLYANGATLQITDFSDPEHPDTLSSLTLDGYIDGLAVAGEYLYMVGGNKFFWVIDISNLNFPFVTSRLDIPKPIDIVTDGSYAYVSSEQLGLVIIDIRTPDAPQILSTIYGSSYVQSAAIGGDHAYVATGDGLSIFNISDKQLPYLVGEVSISQFCRGVDYHDGLVFLAAANQGLYIYDVSVPATPALLSIYQPGGQAEDVQFYNGKVYVANRYSGMYVLDITDPVHPIELGRIDTPRAAGIFVNGYYAYVADTWSVSIVDITDPAQPQLACAVDVGDDLRGVSPVYPRLYTSNNYDGLNIVSLSDIEHPVTQQRYHLSCETLDLFVRDTLVYLADGDHGLKILSTRDTLAPVLLGQLGLSGPASKLDIQGRYAYVTTYSQGFSVVDIENATGPWLIEHHTIDAVATGIAAEGQTLVYTGGFDGLWIYDITDPAFPNFLTMLESTSLFMDAYIEGNRLYLAEGWSGLTIMDISDPNAPVRLLSFDVGGFCFKVVKHGRYLYAGVQEKGVTIIDLKDQQAIKPVAGFVAGTSLVDVDVDNHFVYLTDEKDGVFILEFDSLILSNPQIETENTGNSIRHILITPNPFGTSTVINYVLGSPAEVTLDIYNPDGKHMANLFQGYQLEGAYTVTWDAELSATGINYLCLRAGDQMENRILVHIE